jgi:hypothetical protein
VPEPFGSPAQAVSKIESAIKYIRKKGFRAAFITVYFSLSSSALKAPTEFETRSPCPAAQESIVRVARTGFRTM